MPNQSVRAGLDRRQFVQGMGALLGISPWLARVEALHHHPDASQDADTLPTHPNILIILTDQERHPQWWPQGWADANLPNRKRIADHGLSFRRAYCNSAMCSPSRTTLFTGLYPAQHGVTRTLTEGGTLSSAEPTLADSVQNLAKMLAAAGYNVHYRGKWHMSKHADGSEATSDDIAGFGFNGWIGPDAGQDAAPENFGGGCANHDARFAQEAAAFLAGLNSEDKTPFALIVSFANPHDVLSYPNTWDSEDPGNPGCSNYAAAAPACFAQGIELPPTHEENLPNNFKPTAHAQNRTLLAVGLGPLLADANARSYVNFYGYLQKEVDKHIGTVLDALQASGRFNETVIVRTSDHGEMGLSHGGLRQKMFNVYEETVNVPLVISNPVLFPNPVETDALTSLVDLMPTLATLANVPSRTQYAFMGRDLSPVLTDPAAVVQSSILFTFDDDNCGIADGQTTVTQPNHIRCLIEENWKFALYFDPSGVETPQYELYDRATDPQELHNKAHPDNVDHYDAAKVDEMMTKLTARMIETGTLPYRVALPLVSA